MGDAHESVVPWMPRGCAWPRKQVVALERKRGPVRHAVMVMDIRSDRENRGASRFVLSGTIRGDRLTGADSLRLSMVDDGGRPVLGQPMAAAAGRVVFDELLTDKVIRVEVDAQAWVEATCHPLWRRVLPLGGWHGEGGWIRVRRTPRS